MSTDKVDTITSASSGTVGRADSAVRGQHLVLDSSAHPKPDALTNSEAFLASVSSCGVTLIEGYAHEHGIPLRRMEVTIEGVRTAAEQNRFARVAMSFAFVGVNQSEAEKLVETYRGR
ncbi:MAG TPA: OsmC family protein [Methylomirabilota bacterium]|jgi:uncharacterized OsmC-like protein